jgi:hypothetical protein
MTIKSLLIGSAAAIVAVSTAQAADAIVAADPEPVQYVQVCDAFGDGFFYIPGTETCLKFSGYVQAQAQTVMSTGSTYATTLTNEARLQIEAKSDSEIGTIASTIRLTSAAPGAFNVDRSHISIGDGNVLNVGLNGSIYDFSPVGEQSFIASGGVAGQQVMYTVAADSATFAVQAVSTSAAGAYVAGDVVAKMTFSAGDVSVAAAVGYDGDGQPSDNRIGARLNVAYMGFGLRYDWSQNGNSGSFGNGYTNVYGASYGFDASDKLNIQLAADFADGLGGVQAQDAFALSMNATYTIVENLTVAARVIYTDFNTANTAANANIDNTAIRLRLKRSF